MEGLPTWQKLIHGLFPEVTVTSATELRDWSASRVVRLSATRRDGTPLTLFAKLDRAGDREARVYRAAAHLSGFPAPAARFATAPDGARWLITRQARGIRLHELPPADWVVACRSLATIHERAAAEGWAALIGNLPALAENLIGLPASVLAATEECVRTGQYSGVDCELLSAARQRLGAAWGEVAAAVMSYPQTLLHGDSHSGNVFLSPGGSIELIDWSSAQIGPGLLDLIALFDTAARMGEDCPVTAAMEAYRSGLSAETLRQYCDFGRAFDMLRLVRALSELQWFAASGDDYGARANRELRQILASLE